MMDLKLYAAIYFASFFVTFFILVLITREIFAIPRLLRYQKAQVRLLEEMAKAQGVGEDRVKKIISEGIIEWEPVSQ